MKTTIVFVGMVVVVGVEDVAREVGMYSEA